MSALSLDRLLAQLEESRYRFDGAGSAHVLKLVRAVNAVPLSHPTPLIRFHEVLLFLRAFPHNPSVLRAVERILSAFHVKVEALCRAGVDMDSFDTFEVSGIVGTTMEDTLSFDVARWLVGRLPHQVEISWGNYDPGRALGTTAPRFLPLLEDDATVEADTPWQLWLEAASGISRKRKDSQKKGATLAWLIDAFEKLPLPPQKQSELYESLRIPLRWDLGNSHLSRTRNWKPVRSVFYHDSPLINRSEVSLADELARKPPVLKRLSLREGQTITEQIREIMLVRYRELYGTTLADPSSVVRVDVGRGISIYLWNLPPDRRLPLRAYVAGFTAKNGVPINYIEAIGICEWMEVGFNTFYTFRGGEAGWIYAQVLRCLCHMMGTTCVSVYPYQLGHDNDEAIQSGAFWFYRKLGFRPGRVDLRELVRREEKKIAAHPKYRTPARTLKRLATGHVFYDLPGSDKGAWDTFSTRNMGLRVNQRMAAEFNGDAGRMRAHSTRTLEKALSVRTSSWPPLEKAAFESMALVLSQPNQLRHWSLDERAELLLVIRDKPNPDEMLYLHRTQRHARLRETILSLGS